MEAEFRFATEADIPAIVTLVNAAFQVEKFFKVGERTDEAEVRAHLASGRFLLLEDEQQLVGSIYVELHTEEPRKEKLSNDELPHAERHEQRGYIGMLAIAPTRQRQGIGTQMMAAGEEFCREMGCRFIDITVVDLRTELPTLYAKYGYIVTGTAPFPAEAMPVSQPCSFITMSKALTGK